ncbi:MAG: UPF0175 family protein [Candidatus Nanoarchaeia archaeon]|nr:UPF0175 family protein [Candidatus Nanoarchaeia archaeon]
MDKPITTRLPKESLIKIKEISEKEHVDISTAIRKLLAEAIKEWKIKYALERYSEGDFSLGQAAEFAEVSVWDFPELLKKYKVNINYDKEELEEDLKAIKWEKR